MTTEVAFKKADEEVGRKEVEEEYLDEDKSSEKEAHLQPKRKIFKKEEMIQQQKQQSPFPFTPLIKNNHLDIPLLTNTNLLKTPDFYYYYYFNLLSQNSNNHQNLASIANTASALTTKALAIQANLLQQQQNDQDTLNNTQLFSALLNSTENNLYSNPLNPLLAANDFLQINNTSRQQKAHQSTNQIYKNYIGQLASNLLPQSPIQQFLLPGLANSKQSILSSQNSNVSLLTGQHQLVQTPPTMATPITTTPINNNNNIAKTTATLMPPILINNKKKSQTDYSIEPPRKHPKKQEKPKKLKNIINNNNNNNNHENIENSTTNEYEASNSNINNNSQLDINDNFDSTSNQSLSTSINFNKNSEQKSLNISSDVSFFFCDLFV